jgi:hypothetical protein
MKGHTLGFIIHSYVHHYIKFTSLLHFCANTFTYAFFHKQYHYDLLSVNPDAGITADDIINNPDLYKGQDVLLRAEVEEWINPRAFILDTPGLVDDNLLVLTREPTLVFEDPEVFGDAI